MDAPRTDIATRCLAAAYNRTMAFPEIVGTLMKAGYEGYVVDYRRNATTYFGADGESVTLENPSSDGRVAAAFDEAGIAAQIKWAQSNPPDYSYADFCRNVKALGCAGYFVSFLGKRVLYVGRTADTHVEYFPR